MKESTKKNLVTIALSALVFTLGFAVGISFTRDHIEKQCLNEGKFKAHLSEFDCKIVTVP